LMCYCVESCVQKYIQVQVPEMLEPGYVVSQVNLDDCEDGPLALISSDPDFTVHMDGTIQAVLVTTIPEDGRSFWITVHNRKGHRWFVDVILSPPGQVSSNTVLRRSKRRWSPPPFSIKENDKGPFPKQMEMIASDSSVNYSVYYTIDGPGVDKDPTNIFSLTKNGMLSVLKTVDREKYAQFKFTAYAHNSYGSQQTDDPLPITVLVEDENDNAPEFTGSMQYAVQEKCPMSTFIGKVLATDKDQPDTLHTKIKYTLRNGTDLFKIDPYAGDITAITNTLDRETLEKYILEIEIRDMNGDPSGLFSIGRAVVFLNDINDNPPTFAQQLYKGQVAENKADVMVLRIPVEDRDLKNTPNWKAVYSITKGNETGNFDIKTDPATNDALLYVTKPLDYEKQQTVNLEVTAKNEVPLVGTTSTWQKVPVELRVEDVDEGPEFSTPTLMLKVKENVANGTLIGTYTAIDPETKSSKDIKYYKLTDRGSWINVMDTTGELRTAMTIDRESPLVYNNTYNITVKAVDKSQKSGTGTVLILIEDVNDNIPVITKPDQVLCSKDVTGGSILIEANDLDQKPYSDPFTFELGSGTDGQWKITSTTATSAKLVPAVALPNGVYQVPILVNDLQGFGKEQTVTVRVCDCTNGGVCAPKRLSTALGVWGVLAMLLGLLLLLLLCLLCVFVCNTKGEKMAMIDDTVDGGMLLKSNLEAPGEEVKDQLMLISAGGADKVDMSKGSMLEHQTQLSSFDTGFGQKQSFGSMHQNSMQGFMTNTLPTGQYSTGIYGNSYKKYSTMSTMDGWRENMIQLDT
ncbi:desmocollin-2-like isoform X1, partial [Clarias magur]